MLGVRENANFGSERTLPNSGPQPLLVTRKTRVKSETDRAFHPTPTTHSDGNGVENSCGAQIGGCGFSSTPSTENCRNREFPCRAQFPPFDAPGFEEKPRQQSELGKENLTGNLRSDDTVIRSQISSQVGLAELRLLVRRLLDTRYVKWWSRGRFFCA